MVDWTRREEIAKYIKNNLLEEGVLDSLNLDRASVLAANIFGIEDEDWYQLVKRASAEFETAKYLGLYQKSKTPPQPNSANTVGKKKSTSNNKKDPGAQDFSMDDLIGSFEKVCISKNFNMIVKLPSVIAPWGQEGSQRAMVIIWMLSGFSKCDIKELTINESNVLQVMINLPPTVLNKGKVPLFEHRKFGNHFMQRKNKPVHTLVDSTKQVIGKAVKKSGGDLVAVIEVQLPKDVVWVETPFEICGHESRIFMEVPGELDEKNKRKDVDTRIIAMFDLMEKNAVEGPKFSELEEEESVGDSDID